MAKSATAGKVTKAKMPLDPMVPLSRGTGSSRQVRQSQIIKIVEFVQANPGYTALDVSQHTHVPVDSVNWILDCAPEANKLARAGMVARPTRGPLPLWAEQVPPDILPSANPNALMLAPGSGVAPLDPSITHPFARQEGETARAKIGELMRFSGGSSPARAKRANQIMEMSVSLLCLRLQEQAEHFEDLQEEIDFFETRLKNSEGRAVVAEERASQLDEIVDAMNAQILNLQQQAMLNSAKFNHMLERASLNASIKSKEDTREDSKKTP